MQLALMWVQENAHGLGGNAASVTLGGQSSGGTAIFALLSAPASRGLFTGAIAWSGSPNMSMPLRTVFPQNAPIVKMLGCADPQNPAAEMACLRNQSLGALAAANLPE